MNWAMNAGPASLAFASEEELSVDVLNGGSSSIFQVRKAKSEVPVNRLAAADQKVVKSVLSDTSIYRKLPEVRCETAPQVLEFFLDHPDIAVSVWRALGVSELQLTQTAGNKYHADAGDGSVGTVQVMLREDRQRVIYCDGRFVNPVARSPIQAKCVLHFRNRYEKTRQGLIYARHSATMFVSLPQSAIEAAARVISPVSNRIADKNFEEVSLFIRMMSVAMTSRLGWCEKVADRLDGVPSGSGNKFFQLAETLHQQNGILQTAARGS